MQCVHNRFMLPLADNPRLLILPAEEVFHLAAVLGVVEDVADRGGMQRSGVLTCEDPFAAKGEKFEV